MILAVFLGNDVMGDDGVAFHLMKHLRDQMPAYVRSVYLHTDILRLLHAYGGEEKIVFIDAVKGRNYPCGSVNIIPMNKIDSLSAPMKHAHLIGVIDSIRLLERSDQSLAEAGKVFFLIGVDEENVKPSTYLSSCLEKAIPHIGENLLSLFEKMHYSC